MSSTSPPKGGDTEEIACDGFGIGSEDGNAVTWDDMPDRGDGGDGGDDRGHPGTHENAALAYVAQSLAVVRVRPRQRAALTTWDDSTTDPEVVSVWWRETPDAGIGIRVPPGLLFVDVDPRHGGNLNRLAPLPPTSTVLSGGGGWHLWFLHPGVKLRYQIDDYGPAINLILPGKPAYLPPTIHPSGQRYQWENMAPPAPMPAHLVEQFRDRRTKPHAPSRPASTHALRRLQQAVLERQIDRTRSLRSGCRNRGLFEAGLVLGKHDIPEHAALDALLPAAPIDHDFTETEARTAIRSGWRIGQRGDRSTRRTNTQ